MGFGPYAGIASAGKSISDALITQGQMQEARRSQQLEALHNHAASVMQNIWALPTIRQALADKKTIPSTDTDLVTQYPETKPFVDQANVFIQQARSLYGPGETSLLVHKLKSMAGIKPGTQKMPPGAMTFPGEFTSAKMGAQPEPQQSPLDYYGTTRSSLLGIKQQMKAAGGDSSPLTPDEAAEVAQQAYEATQIHMGLAPKPKANAAPQWKPWEKPFIDPDTGKLTQKMQSVDDKGDVHYKDFVVQGAVPPELGPKRPPKINYEGGRPVSATWTDDAGREHTSSDPQAMLPEIRDEYGRQLKSASDDTVAKHNQKIADEISIATMRDRLSEEREQKRFDDSFAKKDYSEASNDLGKIQVAARQSGHARDLALNAIKTPSGPNDMALVMEVVRLNTNRQSMPEINKILNAAGWAVRADGVIESAKSGQLPEPQRKELAAFVNNDYKSRTKDLSDKQQLLDQMKSNALGGKKMAADRLTKTAPPKTAVPEVGGTFNGEKVQKVERIQ